MKLCSVGDVVFNVILGGLPLTKNGQEAMDVDTSAAILWTMEESR